MTKPKELQLGDKVQMLRSYNDDPWPEKMIGVVKMLPDDEGNWTNDYGVEFSDWDDGHSCHGSCEAWKGWWCERRELRYIS